MKREGTTSQCLLDDYVSCIAVNNDKPIRGLLRGSVGLDYMLPIK